MLDLYGALRAMGLDLTEYQAALNRMGEPHREALIQNPGQTITPPPNGWNVADLILLARANLHGDQMDEFAQEVNNTARQGVNPYLGMRGASAAFNLRQQQINNAIKDPARKSGTYGYAHMTEAEIEALGPVTPGVFPTPEGGALAWKPTPPDKTLSQPEVAFKTVKGGKLGTHRPIYMLGPDEHPLPTFSGMERILRSGEKYQPTGLQQINMAFTSKFIGEGSVYFDRPVQFGQTATIRVRNYQGGPEESFSFKDVVDAAQSINAGNNPQNRYIMSSGDWDKVKYVSHRIQQVQDKFGKISQQAIIEVVKIINESGVKMDWIKGMGAGVVNPADYQVHPLPGRESFVTQIAHPSAVKKVYDAPDLYLNEIVKDLTSRLGYTRHDALNWLGIQDEDLSYRVGQGFNNRVFDALDKIFGKQGDSPYADPQTGNVTIPGLGKWTREGTFAAKRVRWNQQTARQMRQIDPVQYAQAARYTRQIAGNYQEVNQAFLSMVKNQAGMSGGSAYRYNLGSPVFGSSRSISQRAATIQSGMLSTGPGSMTRALKQAIEEERGGMMGGMAPNNLGPNQGYEVELMVDGQLRRYPVVSIKALEFFQNKIKLRNDIQGLEQSDPAEFRRRMRELELQSSSFVTASEELVRFHGTYGPTGGNPSLRKQVAERYEQALLTLGQSKSIRSMAKSTFVQQGVMAAVSTHESVPLNQAAIGDDFLRKTFNIQHGDDELLQEVKDFLQRNDVTATVKRYPNVIASETFTMAMKPMNPGLPSNSRGMFINPLMISAMEGDGDGDQIQVALRRMLRIDRKAPPGQRVSVSHKFEFGRQAVLPSEEEQLRIVGRLGAAGQGYAELISSLKDKYKFGDNETQRLIQLINTGSPEQVKEFLGRLTPHRASDLLLQQNEWARKQAVITLEQQALGRKFDASAGMYMGPAYNLNTKVQAMGQASGKSEIYAEAITKIYKYFQDKKGQDPGLTTFVDFISRYQPASGGLKPGGFSGEGGFMARDPNKAMLEALKGLWTSESFNTEEGHKLLAQAFTDNEWSLKYLTENAGDLSSTAGSHLVAALGLSPWSDAQAHGAFLATIRADRTAAWQHRERRPDHPATDLKLTRQDLAYAEIGEDLGAVLYDENNNPKYLTKGLNDPDLPLHIRMKLTGVDIINRERRARRFWGETKDPKWLSKRLGLEEEEPYIAFAAGWTDAFGEVSTKVTSTQMAMFDLLRHGPKHIAQALSAKGKQAISGAVNFGESSIRTVVKATKDEISAMQAAMDIPWLKEAAENWFSSGRLHFTPIGSAPVGPSMSAQFSFAANPTARLSEFMPAGGLSNEAQAYIDTLRLNKAHARKSRSLARKAILSGEWDPEAVPEDPMAENFEWGSIENLAREDWYKKAKMHLGQSMAAGWSFTTADSLRNAYNKNMAKGVPDEIGGDPNWMWAKSVNSSTRGMTEADVRSEASTRNQTYLEAEKALRQQAPGMSGQFLAGSIEYVHEALTSGQIPNFEEATVKYHIPASNEIIASARAIALHRHGIGAPNTNIAEDVANVQQFLGAAGRQARNSPEVQQLVSEGLKSAYQVQQQWVGEKDKQAVRLAGGLGAAKTSAAWENSPEIVSKFTEKLTQANDVLTKSIQTHTKLNEEDEKLIRNMAGLGKEYGGEDSAVIGQLTNLHKFIQQYGAMEDLGQLTGGVATEKQRQLRGFAIFRGLEVAQQVLGGFQTSLANTGSYTTQNAAMLGAMGIPSGGGLSAGVGPAAQYASSFNLYAQQAQAQSAAGWMESLGATGVAGRNTAGLLSTLADAGKTGIETAAVLSMAGFPEVGVLAGAAATAGQLGINAIGTTMYENNHPSANAYQNIRQYRSMYGNLPMLTDWGSQQEQHAAIQAPMIEGGMTVEGMKALGVEDRQEVMQNYLDGFSKQYGYDIQKQAADIGQTAAWQMIYGNGKASVAGAAPYVALQQQGLDVGQLAGEYAARFGGGVQGSANVWLGASGPQQVLNAQRGMGNAMSSAMAMAGVAPSLNYMAGLGSANLLQQQVYDKYGQQIQQAEMNAALYGVAIPSGIAQNIASQTPTTKGLTDIQIANGTTVTLGQPSGYGRNEMAAQNVAGLRASFFAQPELAATLASQYQEYPDMSAVLQGAAGGDSYNVSARARSLRLNQFITRQANGLPLMTTENTIGNLSPMQSLQTMLKTTGAMALPNAPVRTGGGEEFVGGTMGTAFVKALQDSPVGQALLGKGGSMRKMEWAMTQEQQAAQMQQIGIQQQQYAWQYGTNGQPGYIEQQRQNQLAQFQANWGLNVQQANVGFQFQGQQMGHEQFLTQQQHTWAQQDVAYQRMQTSREYGHTMTEYAMTIPYETGRQRRMSEYEKSYATQSYNIEQSRQTQLAGREQTQFKQSMDWLGVEMNQQKVQHDFQMKGLQLEYQFYMKNYALEEQNYKKESDWQKEILDTNTQLTKDQIVYDNAMKLYSQYISDVNDTIQNLMKNTPAEWQAMMGAISQHPNTTKDTSPNFSLVGPGVNPLPSWFSPPTHTSTSGNPMTGPYEPANSLNTLAISSATLSAPSTYNATVGSQAIVIPVTMTLQGNQFGNAVGKIMYAGAQTMPSGGPTVVGSGRRY